VPATPQTVRTAPTTPQTVRAAPTTPPTLRAAPGGRRHPRVRGAPPRLVSAGSAPPTPLAQHASTLRRLPGERQAPIIVIAANAPAAPSRPAAYPAQPPAPASGPHHAAINRPPDPSQKDPP